MTEQLNRRKFLRGSAVAGAAALATPAIAEGHGETLKMQAAWGGGIFLENAQSYVNRVNEMSGGDLTIDLLPVNSVVKTSQMQDAVHRGVLDAAHYVPAYWYSKSKAASLFGTGPCFGWSSQEVLGWLHYGGGQELFDELMASLGLNVVSFFNSPMPAQPMGWFKEQITDASQMSGLKYRTVGLAADVLLEMGMSVVQLPGGEIQPAMKSGLIDAAEFQERRENFDYDVITTRFVLPLSPSTEMRTLFGSASAEQPGSFNVSGVSDEVVDALIDAAIKAEDRDSLNVRIKALDRVLRDKVIWAPNWFKGSHWIAYWDVFGRPEVKPAYDRGIDYWWWDQAKYEALKAEGALR